MTESPHRSLRVEVRVTCDPHDAFAHFTRDFGSWWPLASHSVGQENATGCAIELYPGGKIWERTATGAQHVWGRVLDCDELGSLGLSFTWHPGRPSSTAQTVKVRFRRAPSSAGTNAAATAEAGSPQTEVVLEHGDWHVFGPAADHARSQYRDGWSMVLGRFRRSLEASLADLSNPSAR